MVGVNRFTADEPTPIDVLEIDPVLEAQQIERVRALRDARDRQKWTRTIDDVRNAARGTANLLPPIIAAVEAHATVGEIANTLRQVFGEHQEGE